MIVGCGMSGAVEKSEQVGRGWRLVGGLLAIYAAGFLLYAETRAFAFDETYHLVAAQLVLAGRRPYLDFCFPQTLLNVYWNAGWMRVLGQNWHAAHAVAAALTIGAVLLTADFVGRRFPVPGWRAAGALTAGLMVGLNCKVFFFGPLAQPYGICLCALVAAFRLGVRSVGQAGTPAAAGAGFFAGAAAGSSLLTAAATPVLLVWMLAHNRAGSRWRKSAAFAAFAAVPFTPVLRLFRQGPRETWFDLFQYHSSFRRLYWPETTRHDLEVLTSWIDSPQALAIGFLAVAGWVYVGRSAWPRPVKAEFYLCGWLAAALAVELGSAHPTFAQYYLLIVPFLAIPACAGLYSIGSRLAAPDRALRAALPVAILLTLGLGKSLYDRREYATWRDYYRLAAKIEEVTPRDAPLFANEPIYFLTRRTPPPGLELYYTHKLDLPAADRARLHILTEAELKSEVQAGMFATAYSCDDDQIADYGLKALYRREADIGECSVFWDRR